MLSETGWKIKYLAHTWPDLAYVLSVVSQFMHSPSEEHMNVVIYILRYLKSSPRKGILFTKGDSLDIKGYTDADWAGSIQDRRSTSSYFTFVGGNLVTWQSKKHEVVARPMLKLNTEEWLRQYANCCGSEI